MIWHEGKSFTYWEACSEIFQDANDILRKNLTRGVLPEECKNMPSTCNVCSSRMHTSGNMWVAKCEYIKKFINPLKFEASMNECAKFMNFEWLKDDGCPPGAFSSKCQPLRPFYK